MNECVNGCMSIMKDVINKNFAQQSKFNTKMVVFSLLITTCVFLQHKKIEQLSDEMEELKQTRGE